jgi:hypothetical protein
VLTGTAIAGGVILAVTLTRPANETNAYLREVRDGRYATAYSRLCAARRHETSLRSFTEQQRSRASSDGAILTFDVNRSSLHGNGRASAEYELVRTLARQTWHVDLVKENGTYRLCHFELLSG